MRVSRSDRRIRVCEVLEATEGGTREHLRQIAGHLDRGRFELAFVVSPLRDPTFGHDIAQMRAWGHEVALVPMHRAVRPLGDLVACVRLWRYFARRRFDIVHTHSSKAGIVGRVAAWLAGVPARLHTPHALPFQQQVGPCKAAMYRAIEAIAGRLTTKLVALSTFEERLLLRTGVARPNQVQIVHNGVDVHELPTAGMAARKRHELGLPSDALVVGSVGRLVEQKGHKFLIQAARRVVDALPGATFAIVGEGPLRESLSAEIARLGLGQNVRLMGHRDDVRDLLPALDMLVLPSLWEAMPYSVLEAMAAALPVVAFDVSGIGEFVRHGQHGLLTPAKDPVALSDAIIALGRDESLRLRMGADGREWVRSQFSTRHFVQSLEKLYSTSVFGRG